MMIRIQNTALSALLITISSVAAVGQYHVPVNGYVPDAQTAVQVAEAVLVPVYGKAIIEAERPFTAELKRGTWIVSGTLHCPDGGVCDGGVAVVKLNKADGRVISMIHYK